MKIILSLLVVALLTGCQTVSYTWYKPGVTPEQTQQDISEARKQANALPPIPAPAFTHTGTEEYKTQLSEQQRRENEVADQLNRERYFRARMEAKGYTYIPVSQAK